MSPTEEHDASCASSEYQPEAAPPKRRAAKAARKQIVSECTSENEAPKKRGRKKQKDEDYINAANLKIEKLREDYKKAQRSNATAAQKKRLRNQITAMQSRVKQKQMLMDMSTVVQDMDQRRLTAIKILAEELMDCPAIAKKIQKRMDQELPEDSQSKGKKSLQEALSSRLLTDPQVM